MADPAVSGGGEGEEQEYEDILGDCTILVKRIVITKNPSPKVGEKITIRWTREIPESGKSFPAEDVTFTLGDGDVEQAVELVTSLMKLGEKFTVIAGYKYMFGEYGQEPQVPPKANFKFDIELMSNSGIVDYPNMDFDTRFNEAKKKKERGNILFRRRDYPQALNLYMTACKIVDRDLGFDYPDAPPEKLQEVNEFRAVILCNTSVAQMKSQFYDAAVLSAREATKINPSYSKAFYRLGQAYEKTGQLDERVKAYKKALELNSGDSKAKLSSSELSILQSELEKLEEKQQRSQTSEKQMYSRMFGGDTAAAEAKDKSLDEKKNSNSKRAQPQDNLDEKKNQEHQRPSIPSACHRTTGNLFINQSMFASGVKAAKQSLATSAPDHNTAVATGSGSQHHPHSGSEKQVPDVLQHLAVPVPDIAAHLETLKQRVSAGMTQEEALAMASEILMQIGLDTMNPDPAYLLDLSEKIQALIPNDVHTHFKEFASKLEKEGSGTDVGKEDKGESIADETTKSEDKEQEAEDSLTEGAIGQTNGSSSLIDAADKNTTKKKKGLKGMVNFWEEAIQEHMFPSSVRAAREELLRKVEKKVASKTTKPELLHASGVHSYKKRKQEHDLDKTNIEVEPEKMIQQFEDTSQTPKSSQEMVAKNVEEQQTDTTDVNEEETNFKQKLDLNATLDLDELENGRKLTDQELGLTLDAEIFDNTEDVPCSLDENKRSQEKELESAGQAELDNSGNNTEATKFKDIDVRAEEKPEEDSWQSTWGYTILGFGVITLVGYGVYRYTRH